MVFLKISFKNFKFRQLSRYKSQMGTAALWTSEQDFLKAVKHIYDQGQVKPCTITPYPIHGLDEATKTPRSWIPWLSLVCGFSGCAFGIWFTWWVSARSWPLIIGGKPSWSLPAFIPVIFELTILFSALGAIFTLLYACGLPHIDPPIIDKDLTCHKFAMFIPQKELDTALAKKLFKDVQAPEIKETEF